MLLVTINYKKLDQIEYMQKLDAGIINLTSSKLNTKYVLKTNPPKI